MSDYTIQIQNCNTIDHAEVRIKKGSLNIKYGPNGLGKSTIARAIVSKIRDDGTLEVLTPFKSRGKPTGKKPDVQGVSELKSALVFDEEYVNQFAFQQDEVVKNSFDIFVKTPDYISTMTEIETLFAGIKKAFSDSPEIEQTTKDLKDLREAFGNSKTGAIPKNSKIHKAFGSGNKVENVPTALKPFELFIKSPEPSKWIAWQIKGNDFLKLGDQCPYCSSGLQEADRKETALAVAKEYDATAVGHLNTLRAIIERLGKYFSNKCQENLDKITKAKIELTAPENAFLSSLKNDIDSLIQKLDGLSTISFFSLRDVDEVDTKVERLKIDLAMIDKLDSADTRAVIDPINAQLQQLLQQIGALKGSINKHKSRISKAIAENQQSINNFLRSAGYKYTVRIIPDTESYKMKLVHNDLDAHIETASKHLSYGEKNAFALVLFMHQVFSENPDIIILDDPISSFDKNKKFAILHQLFRGKASLKGRTTLMLTHDIEPAIDVIKSTSSVFQGSSPSASFLTSFRGEVKEAPIEKNDLQTFTTICRENVSHLTDPLVKAIYLRRHYELSDNVGLEYNLLASLFKKRVTPTVQSSASTRNMTAEEKSLAEGEIQKSIPDFDYDELISVLNNEAEMKKKYFNTSVGYEKIQIFRLIRDTKDDIITKFINEAYHIENEYVMQLNPHKFESVPEYVTDECTRILTEE